MAMISCDQFKDGEQDLLPVVSWVGVEKYMFLLSRCLTAQKSHYVIKALYTYQLFRTRIVPGIETLSHLNSYRSEFVQWYSPILCFNFTGFTGSQSWNIDRHLIENDSCVEPKKYGNLRSEKASCVRCRVWKVGWCKRWMEGARETGQWQLILRHAGPPSGEHFQSQL